MTSFSRVECRGGTCPRCEVGQLGEQVLLKSVHLRTVRREVHVDPPIVDTAHIEAGQYLVESFTITGQKGGGGAVDGGYGHRVLVTDQRCRCLVGGKSDPGHGAAAGQALGQSAAAADHRGGVRERESAGDVSGGGLTHAVADDHVRFDAPGAPELGQGDLHGPEGGLDDVEFLESLFIRRTQQLDDRPAVLRPDGVVAVPHGLVEDRLVVQELAAHAWPLRTLSGEHERDPWHRLGVGVVAEGQAGLVVAVGEPRNAAAASAWLSTGRARRAS